VSVVADITGDATESLLIKNLSVDDEERKWLSDIEWGIEDLIMFVGEDSLFVCSCPFVWSATGLLALFSC
jgi:hypothetical protein